MGTVDQLLASRATNDVVPAADHNDVVNAMFENMAKYVRVASTANVAGTYTNGTSGVGAQKAVGGTSLAIDGITLANGDRVLLKDQTSVFENGIYVVSGVGTAVVLTRSVDADTTAKLADCIVNVADGASAITNADTQYRCTATSLTVGTTALPFRRTLPIYGLGNPRNPWEVGADTTQALAATMVRHMAYTTVTMPTAATHWLYGGIIVPAGRTVTNVNYMYTTAAATITIDYVSVVRLSDRLVLGTSANNTTAWAAAPSVRTRALSTPWVASYDTPVYVGIALASTTAAVLAGGPAFAAATGQHARAPVLLGTTTTPTATPITGTAAALTAGTLGMVYIWLT